MGEYRINKKRTLIAFFGAEDETRTRDPHLGKVMLYQLSHFRKICIAVKQLYKDIIYVSGLSSIFY